MAGPFCIESETRVVAVIKTLWSRLTTTTRLALPRLAGADDGIEEIVAGGMCLRCLQTRTGIKFVVTAEKGTSDMDVVLREIYILVRVNKISCLFRE